MQARRPRKLSLVAALLAFFAAQWLLGAPGPAGGACGAGRCFVPVVER